MRVLLVSPAAEFGGAERCLLDFVTALRSTECVELNVLALADGPLLNEIRALGVTTEVVEPPSEFAEVGESGGLLALRNVARSTPASARFLAHLRQAVVNARPDVVHTNGMKAHLLAGALAPAQARVVVHLHDFIGARRASKWLLPALRHVHQHLSVFVANSHAVAGDFKRLAPNADVRTVYNVVDTDYFRPGAAEPAWLAACAGLEPPAPEAVSFGLVATYARWKGHELFIEAAGRLRAAHPGLPLRVYIVGGPIYKTRGSQVLAEDLLRAAWSAKIGDCFGLVRFQKDIARVYRSLNVVVHASTQPEPFGRTIVEAMACERPVIVSDAGGAAELFQHGENALGFSPGDSQALADAMSEALNEGVRVRLGWAARGHALTQFGAARLGGQLLGVYGFTGG